MADQGNKAEQNGQPMSSQDFALYNGLAEQMEYFHEHFRDMWKVMWEACETGHRPKGMTLRSFLEHGMSFIAYLERHHTIEERFLYPQLAPKLKHFDPDNGDLVGQHKEIHEGMDALQAYLQDCKAGRADFSLAVLKTKMETWGDVLWSHLDDEVEALGAVHMKKAFTPEEFMAIRM